MKTHRFVWRSTQVALLALLALVLGTGPTFAAPSSSGTTTTTIYRIKNDVAAAFYYKYDSCSSQFAQILASDNMGVSGSATLGSAVDISASSINWCTGTFMGGEGYTSLPANALKFTGSGASLSPTDVVFYDQWSGTSFKVTLSGTWSGMSTPVRTRENDQTVGPGVNTLFVGSGTQAWGSVTASAVFPSGDFLTGLNNGGGEIFSDEQAQLTVTHG